MATKTPTGITSETDHSSDAADWNSGKTSDSTAADKHKDFTDKKADSGGGKAWARFGEPTGVKSPGVEELVPQILAALVGKAGVNIKADELDSFVDLAFKLAESIIKKFETYSDHPFGSPTEAGISGYSGFLGKSGYSGFSGVSGTVFYGLSGASSFKGASGASGAKGISGSSGANENNRGQSPKDST